MMSQVRALVGDLFEGDDAFPNSARPPSRSCQLPLFGSFALQRSSLEQYSWLGWTLLLVFFLSIFSLAAPGPT